MFGFGKKKEKKEGAISRVKNSAAAGGGHDITSAKGAQDFLTSAGNKATAAHRAKKKRQNTIDSVKKDGNLGR